MSEAQKQKKPRWHPPIAAPIHYEATTVILADNKGVACVAFRSPPAVEYRVAATSDLIEYRYRYRANDGAETSGQGLLYENRVSVVDGGESGTVDVGGHLQVVAGHFQLEWSQGDAKQGWLYYAPENLRMQFAASDKFDKLNLSRFAQ